MPAKVTFRVNGYKYAIDTNKLRCDGKDFSLLHTLFDRKPGNGMDFIRHNRKTAERYISQAYGIPVDQLPKLLPDFEDILVKATMNFFYKHQTGRLTAAERDEHLASLMRCYRLTHLSDLAKDRIGSFIEARSRRFRERLNARQTADNTKDA